MPEPRTGTTEPDLAREIEERAALARWLAVTLAGEAGVPLPDLTLTAGELAQAARRVNEEWPDGETAQRLESERVSLMVNAPGGVPAPPYGSWWIEGTLQGASTAEVLQIYKEEGLRVEERTGPADYLPAELEFVRFLLQHQRAAILTASPGLERSSRRRESEFIDRFMRPWIGRFCGAGRRSATEPFWGAVFGLLRTFVGDEARRTS